MDVNVFICAPGGMGANATGVLWVGTAFLVSVSAVRRRGLWYDTSLCSDFVIRRGFAPEQGFSPSVVGGVIHIVAGLAFSHRGVVAASNTECFEVDKVR